MTYLLSVQPAGGSGSARLFLPNPFMLRIVSTCFKYVAASLEIFEVRKQKLLTISQRNKYRFQNYLSTLEDNGRLVLVQ